MSGWRLRSVVIAATATASAVLAACGSGARQDASEPHGRFDVAVSNASFPTSQHLAEHTQMVITVRNMARKTIPDVAVTITDADYNSTAQAFAERIDTPSTITSSALASASRPIWIVDQDPNLHGCQYSCRSGGPGGAVTAYSNTWALGALPPGHSATFQWKVTAVKSGVHVVHWRVAAGLNGKAVAQLPDGSPPSGSFTVNINSAPAQSYVNNNGQVVTSP